MSKALIILAAVAVLAVLYVISGIIAIFQKIKRKKTIPDEGE